MKRNKNEIKKMFQENKAVCEKVLQVCGLVANKTRFRILCMLKEGDFCVSDLVEAVGEGKLSYVSQQLHMLSLAGLVSSRREKKQVFYCLADRKISLIIDFFREHYLTMEN